MSQTREYVLGAITGFGLVSLVLLGFRLVLFSRRTGPMVIAVLAKGRARYGGCEKFGHELDDGWCGWCGALVEDRAELERQAAVDFNEWRRKRYGDIDGGEASFPVLVAGLVLVSSVP